MIICRWWRESVGSSGTNLKSGMRKRWRSLRALPIPLEGTPKHGSKAGYEKVARAGAGAGAGADRKAASA